MASCEISLVVCGAPLTARTADLAAVLIADGYAVTVVGTPAAEEWLDADAVQRVTGAAPRLSFRAPVTASRADLPDAVVVCPATFNTVNKVVTGAADTYALAVLCEALGARLPFVVAPMVNNRLWAHPIWAASLNAFRTAGALFVDVRTGERAAAPVESGTGAQVVERFDPAWIASALKAIAPK